MAETKAEWSYWHGSPQLLAQVARAASQAMPPSPEARASCTIDVEVDGDHEVFFSPADFVEGVTREALRRFKSIRIEVAGGGMTGRILMRWRRAWWDPRGVKNEGGTLRVESDAAVHLTVAGADAPAVERAFTAIEAAVKRGRTRGSVRQNLVVGGATLATAAAVAAGVSSALYLLGVDPDVILGVAFGTGLLGWFSGIFWGSWAYPSLEVAPQGQTNLARIVKTVAPVVLSLVITGIGKGIFG